MARSFIKPEFPPLLDVGLHQMTMAELRGLCVDRFADRAISREPIMSGLEALLRKLKDGGIVGNLWVDGSFLTQKSDPGDVDLLLHMSCLS